MQVPLYDPLRRGEQTQVSLTNLTGLKEQIQVFLFDLIRPGQTQVFLTDLMDSEWFPLAAGTKVVDQEIVS